MDKWLAMILFALFVGVVAAAFLTAKKKPEPPKREELFNYDAWMAKKTPGIKK